MDGLQATELIRREERERGWVRLPILGLTAHAIHGYQDTCLSHGMDGYLGKPFDSQQLLKTIGHILPSEKFEQTSRSWHLYTILVVLENTLPLIKVWRELHLARTFCSILHLLHLQSCVAIFAQHLQIHLQQMQVSRCAYMASWSLEVWGCLTFTVQTSRIVWFIAMNM